MAQRPAVRGGGTWLWLEWRCAHRGHSHRDVLLVAPSSIAGRGLRRRTSDGSGSRGDARLLDALAGATACLHTPVDSGVCLPIALVPAGTCVRTAPVPAPAAVDDFMGEPARRFCA